MAADTPIFTLGPKQEPRHQREERLTTTPIPADTHAILVKKLYERIKPDQIERIDRPALQSQIEKAVAQIADEEKLQLGADQQRSMAVLFTDDMRGIGPLQRMLEDEGISDIIVNGPNQVFIERNGKLRLTDITFRDEEHLRTIAQRIARQMGRRVDEVNPICDSRLADGSRVSIVIPPIAIDGTMISIRKFLKDGIGLRQMVASGTINNPMRDFLEIVTKARFNIIISGGTSSGKSTLLNALGQYIPNDESVVTIEDSAELKLKTANVRRLETRKALGEGVTEITTQMLVIAALRMRPDRIIIGECRGAEAFDMLQAMNTGHEGSMSTMHANTTRDAISRLENMNLMAFDRPIRTIRQEIVSACNLIIQAERMSDGVRRVTEIAEVVSMEGEVVSMQPLFKFEIENVKAGEIQGRHVTCPVSLYASEKLKRAGLYEAARNIFSKA